jgi:UDP-N-acetylmuramoyl-L-alanyl-D-glutamate--2,6-diaminopimelate ligase
MALSAAAVHGFPSHELQVVGITGTNGKTTTAYMLGAILSAADVRNQVAGTLSGVRTTPEATDLQRALRSWHEDGGQAYVMEVSSHALHQDRVLGTRFAVGIFTNLGIDHLDYHGTVEAYFAAKARLFTTGMTDRAVINRDDVHGQQLLDVLGASAVAFGLSDATDVVVGPDSVRFTWSGVAMHLPMGGTFNLANALGAATAARELGIRIDAIADGLSSMRPVRGRLEPVANDRGIVVLVDYAHTADALDRVLTSVRTSMGSQGKLTVVFGCGGDRDASKRGPMGAVASQLADRVILTADNSRSEDTSSIIDQIMAGISAKNLAAPVTQILDREEAIAEAIAASVRGDVVVIAGKGHETTQEIAGLVTEFDDAAVARRILGAGK